MDKLTTCVSEVLNSTWLVMSQKKDTTAFPVGKVKVKVNQSRYRPAVAQRVLRKLRFPDFVTTAQDGGRLSALRTGRLYPQEMLQVLISVRGWIDPRAVVRSEGFLCQWKNPLTPAGIEPTTFRFVTEHLNHWATAVPPLGKGGNYIFVFNHFVCGKT